MNEKVKKYIRVIFSRVWVILLLGVLSAATVYFSYSKVYEEKFEAKIKLIITTTDSNNQNVSVFDSIRSSQMAVGDISQIIASDAVLTNVEKESNVNQTKISQALNINAIPNTRILDISVKMNSPEISLKVIQSIDKNLREKLKEVDKYLTYKILSKPYVDNNPVNASYPIIFTIAGALGGIILGGLINLILCEMSINAGKLNRIKNLFECDSILPVPVSKSINYEGGNL